MPDLNWEQIAITLGQFRAVTRDLSDDAPIVVAVLSAPFDDEAVELQELVIEGGQVFLCVAVVDDVAREIQAEDEAARGDST